MSAKLSFFLFFALLAGLAAAEIVPAVSITAGPAATDLIPGYNYSRSATVAWAIEPSQIQGLEGQTVRVFVNVSVNSGSWAFFNDGAKSVLLELDCVVNNGACADGSVLSVEVPYVLRVPQQGGTDDGEFSAVASFTPFVQAEAPSIEASQSPAAEAPAAQSDLPDVTGFLSMILAPASVVAVLFTALVVTVYIHSRK